MRIILEGCDGTGKSTLARLLADKYKLDLCHCTQSDPGDFEFYKQTARKDNVIWDRHTIGELIYPDVFGRKQKLSPEDARLVIYLARQQGTKIFVLTTDIDEIRRRLTARGTEDQRVLDKLEWINERFLRFADMFDIPVIDTSNASLSMIFDFIENYENYYHAPFMFAHYKED